jgi:hypothetical protein
VYTRLTGEVENNIFCLGFGGWYQPLGAKMRPMCTVNEYQIRVECIKFGYNACCAILNANSSLHEKH